ncbi:uncharacterized protein C1orf109 homolog [Nothoprocta perdicaria]|uniref:uncharacterized protein C1orf109 homolog n=1 Tax=Nothoprocta perdicaria TaxID=30464 RepID=UPI000E1BBBDE|nr:uncharacterized protein C1orf109 homolog [Nothoprocta perdicaria]
MAAGSEFGVGSGTSRRSVPTSLLRRAARARPRLNQRPPQRDQWARTPRDALTPRRAELRAVRDAVGSAVGAALRLYEERAGELGLAVALRRGPRCPALAEALEGLHDVERHYRLLYLESSLLLQRISCDDLDTMEALPQAWECILERHKPHVVQDTLLKISLFLDNQ